MARSSAPVRLTAFAHGAGCACKIPRDRLASILGALSLPGDPDLLVGSEGSDDAAAFRLGDGRALIHTADFFTPIVDDPYDFGRIAATNALSDVYAMGGDPVLALNLVAFPLGEIGEDVLGQILRGGAEAVAAAGAAVGGGHSIDDPEPKYGLAVSGLVEEDRMLTNAGGRAGDVLVLTKPVGAGLATTAAKRDIAPAGVLDAAVAVMCELNDRAARAATGAGASAATDVTGFGLLGHLNELALASGLAAEVEAAAVPALEGVLDLAANADAIAGGSRRNAEQAEQFTVFDPAVTSERRTLLSDAMTSGGLLVAIDPKRAHELPGVTIGRLSTGEPGRIAVR